VGSTFGHTFRLSTWGESHGTGIGVVIDGCPPRLPLTADDLQADLDRRRPGQSRLTSQRGEADRAEILSGVFDGRTTGAPIAVLVRNDDARPSAYDHLRDLYRPSHADWAYDAKYGHRDWRGGGRASARETIGRVAAGAIARQLLGKVAGIEVLAWVSRVHDLVAFLGDRDAAAGHVELALAGGDDRAVPGKLLETRNTVDPCTDLVHGVVVPTHSHTGVSRDIGERQVSVVDCDCDDSTTQVG